jgi:mannose-6-phosphate isomerase-like protein (cupin superfamily)
MTEHFFAMEKLVRAQQESKRFYFEFLRVPAMSAGVYCLPKGSVDTQKPHHQDEMYYVVQGKAHMQVGVEREQVSPGSVIFVEAKTAHRFYDIEEDLVVLVFFAPAETEAA